MRILLSAILLTAFPVSNATTILIDFSNPKSTLPTLGGSWNIVRAFGTSTTPMELADSSNSLTEVKLSYAGFAEVIGQTPFASSVGWVDLQATSQLSVIDFINPLGTISITGLDPESIYQVDFLAAREAGPDFVRFGNYQLNGSFADSVPNGNRFNALTDGYANQSILTWNGVQGSSFDITIQPDASYAYATAMRIKTVETVDEPFTLALLGLGVIGFAYHLSKSTMCAHLVADTR